jgi:glycosyltransferase involved in cell wall biosynthesis
MHKMAIPLIERGHNVHLISFKVSTFWEQYKTFSLCADVEQAIEAMRLFVRSGNVDLFHCHNEPSWFVTAIKEITDEIPVLLDVHDSYLARSSEEEALAVRDKGEIHIRETTEERNNFQLADGLVFPGDAFRSLVSGEFKLDQPALTLPSYVPRRFFNYKARDWHGGLCYEGKVNLPKETKGAHTGFAYCEYTDLAKRTHDMGMDFHLYSGREDKKFLAHYSDIAYLHRAQNYEDLMASLSRHDWGLVGNIQPTREWKLAMPNKLFEYMAASVPVAVMNADDCASFVKDQGVGIVVDTPEELGERWAEHRESRKRLIKTRQDWTMNAHIHKLEGFYQHFV